MRKPVTRSARRLLGLLSVVACALPGDAVAGQMQMTEMASRAGITIVTAASRSYPGNEFLPPAGREFARFSITVRSIGTCLSCITKFVLTSIGTLLNTLMSL